MPLPEVHPFTEQAVATTTATVVNAQTATIYAPYTGRLMSLAATTGAAVTGTGAATCTATIAGTTAGTLVVPAATAIGVNTPAGINAGCAQGDPVVLTWSGAATAGGPVGIIAYFRRGG